MSEGGGSTWSIYPHTLIDSGVWAVLKGAERGVLGVLIRHVRRDSGEAWPGIPRMARGAGVSEGTVSKAIDRLIELGVIERVRSGGGRRGGSRKGQTTVYRIPSVVECAGNHCAGEGVSESKPSRPKRDTPAHKAANPRASAVGTDKEQKKEQGAPAPDAPALKRRRPAWLLYWPEREGRLPIIAHALRRLEGGEEAWRRGGSIVAMVEAGILTPEELDTDPREVARLILDRIGAQGGASVRDGA